MPPSCIYALLPGRRVPILLCHEEPATCERCLSAIAEFLAAEMDWQVSQALDRQSASYGAELSRVEFLADHWNGCTLEQASDLRRLTVEACFRRQCERFCMSFIPAAALFVVADEAVLTSEATR